MEGKLSIISEKSEKSFQLVQSSLSDVCKIFMT